ncbi:MAG: hypothetical protein ACOWWO_19635, partial [Peptococcaceae bacterium]
CDACKKEMEELAGLHNNLKSVLKTATGDVVPPVNSLAVIKERAGIKTTPVKNGFWGRMSAPAGVALSLFLALVTLISSMSFLSEDHLFTIGGPPPPEPPILVGDDSGGAYIVWLDGAHQEIIRAQHIDSQGNNLWEEQGKQIATVYGYVYAVNDGSGGLIISWRNDDTTYLERLDASGNIVWILESFTSLKLRAMTSDDSGNTLLLLYDDSSRIYVQKIGGDGSVLWNEGNVLLGISEGDYTEADIVGDGSGGAVIIWQEEVDGDLLIRVQRISSGGEILWADEGLVITSIAGSRGASHQIIYDGLGNFFITWDTNKGYSGYDIDVYAQKLDGEGNFIWDKQGVLVCDDKTVNNSYSTTQSNPLLATDDTGGAVVIWKDRRRILNGEVYAQRIGANGDILWEENGIWIWDIPEDYPDTAGILDSDIISGEDGSVIVVWTGYDSLIKNTIVYAQKIDRNGGLLWSNGTVYNNQDILSQGYSNIIGNGSGGVIIVSRTGVDSNLSNTASIYVQHIDSQGNLPWGESGEAIRLVSPAPTALIIAAFSLIIAVIVIIGLILGKKSAQISTPVISLGLFFLAMYCVNMMHSTLGNNINEWSYILNTTLNWVAIWVIILAGLALAVLGIKKAKLNKWIMIPVFVPYVLWTGITILWICLSNF